MQSKLIAHADVGQGDSTVKVKTSGTVVEALLTFKAGRALQSASSKDLVFPDNPWQPTPRGPGLIGWGPLQPV